MKIRAKKKSDPKHLTSADFRAKLPFDPDAPIPYSLPDSGARKASSSGSLREPKPVTDGRYDLIPPACLLAMRQVCDMSLPEAYDRFLAALSGEDRGGLAIYARALSQAMGGGSIATHRLAVHYARGAAKYADRNWEKGQETGWLVDSAQRHAFKYSIGNTTEDHQAAILWNVFGLMWTLDRIEKGQLPFTLDTAGILS